MLKLTTKQIHALTLLSSALDVLNEHWTDELGTVLADQGLLPQRDLDEAICEIDHMIETGKAGTRQETLEEEAIVPPLISCQDCWEARGIKQNGEICETCGGSGLVSEGEPGSEGYSDGNA